MAAPLLPQQAMPPPHAPDLGETYDLVEEILIRIPPGEPGGLIRASLVCKAWCRLLSGHAFRGRYRAFHGTPPILGFLHSWGGDHVERFIPTTNFRPQNPDPRDRFVLDCRHGRVLLGGEEEDEVENEEEEEASLHMVVWDPVSGSRTELPEPADCFRSNYSAAVLCAAADGCCNHIACNSAPFLVAFVSTDDKSYLDLWDGAQEKRLLRASVYSSETRKWSSPAAIHISLSSYLDGTPCVMVGRALYCLLHGQLGLCILKYDLGTHSLSVIDLPRLREERMQNPLLISAADGGLVFVDQNQHGLCTM